MGASRVAVIADVHGNAIALAAVLRELERDQPDALVHCGDLTWGALPGPTADLVAESGLLEVRGNAAREVVELASGLRDGGEAATCEHRMAEQHGEALRSRLPAFHSTVELEIDGLGEVLPYHGSPRSDEEPVTVETPEIAAHAESSAFSG